MYLRVLFGIGLKIIMAFNCSEEQLKYNDLIKNFSSQQTERVEILNIPSYILTRTDITKEMLEHDYNYKMVLTKSSNLEEFQSLFNALKNEKVASLSNKLMNLRWGCVFYNKQNEKVLSIFLTGDGKKGLVQDCPVSFGTIFLESSIYHWLKRNENKLKER